MSNFNDIQPYSDDEILAAMQRMADNPLLPSMLHYAMPNVDIEAVREKIRHIKSSDQFQSEIMVDVVENLIHHTASGWDWSGTEKLEKRKPCLFVCNHRDIVLDAMLLQYILLKTGHCTSQIAFGDNLMFDEFATDFWKSNKMFQTGRSGSTKEQYNRLMIVSEYIRNVVTEQKMSVWIAQSNGRTKNGNDVTDPAIIKMLGMSRNDDRVASLAELNIVPMTVSYEWEPCDKLKTLELYARHKNGHYEKQPGEDRNSILTGITQQKGHISYRFSEPFTWEDLNQFRDCQPNAFYKNVASLIDDSIVSNYQLFCNNYIAHDLRSGEHNYVQHYSDQQKEQFLQYMSWIEDSEVSDKDALRTIFLDIYANPIDNKNRNR